MIKPPRNQNRPGEQSGFTLAEVAVTLVIVSITLIFVLQGLAQARLTAFYTTDRKIARQLALETLSQIESGLYWEDVQESGDKLVGTYAEEGYESFEYEVLFGEEDDFRMSPQGLDNNEYSGFDSWSRDRDSDRDGVSDSEEIGGSDEDEEEIAEPYEVVRIQVMFPTLGMPDVTNTIVLERWITWKLVYGEDEDEEGEDGNEDSPSGGDSR
ncbi:MAG: prepilin-type N-terminal cleavage/methylation domain-containing protein [Planctomycetota bacterium]|jgi:prepilin-type N-terminal cleavage/methylation domain-containing protein